ncbi:MAG TPA: tetratricopeptide repeat protein, partial [Herpetosiphonaceae bacterium]
ALADARFWQAVALTEEGLAASRNQPGGLKRLWDGLFGEDTPLEQAQQKLAAYTRQFEGDYGSRVLFGRVNRLIGQPNLALEQYVRASELAPERPEGWYGAAIVRWESERASPERDAQVREALAKALALDPNYTPAHYLMARVELAAEQWAAALPHLEWLHARRPADDAAALSLGRAQRRLNLLPEAEQTLLPLANASHGPALVELALVYEQAQRLDSAEEVLRRSLDLDGGNAVAAYQLGRLLQSQGKFPEAEQAYQAAIRANPDYMEAHLALGQLYGRVMNRSDLAIESYRRAIEAGGNDARNFEDLGQEFLEMGQYEEAATALERSIALNPNVPEAQHALGQAYLELGRFEMARERERAAIARKADGPYPAAQLGIGESFRREGRWEEATQAFNQVLDDNPDEAAAYVGLGRTAASQFDWQSAIGYYNQALARDPDDTNAHFWMGQALIEQGFNERALDEFDLVLQADPNNVMAYYGSGRAHSRIAENLYGVDPAEAQRYDAEARRLLNEALARRPTYAAALLERGIVNERQGLTQAALSDYAQAAAADQRLATAPYLQGKLQLSLNDVAGATAALEDSVRRDAKNGQALYWLGRAYRAQNRPGDAIKSFQLAIELNKGYTEALYFLGLTQQESNLPGDARASYGAVVSQAPAEDRWRQQAEERLRELDGDQ